MTSQGHGAGRTLRHTAVKDAIYEGLRTHRGPGSDAAGEMALADMLTERALQALDNLEAMDR